MKRADVPLTMEMIDDIFFEETLQPEPHQAEILFALYRLAFPDWDLIRKVNGWPKVSNTTSEYICGKFITFDRRYHPDCISGGCWMNRGFTIDKSVPDWVIEPLEDKDVLYWDERNPMKAVFVTVFGPFDNSPGVSVRINFHREFDTRNDDKPAYHRDHISPMVSRLINIAQKHIPGAGLDEHIWEREGS